MSPDLSTLAQQGLAVTLGLLHCMLALKEGSWKSQLADFIPKSLKKVQLIQPLWPIPGSRRDPPCSHPFSITPSTQSGMRFFRTGRSLVAWCPLALPFPHRRDAGNAHLWVSSANTPTSLNSLDAQSGAPVPNSLRFLRQHPQQWPSPLRTLHPRLPSRPPAQDSSGK